MGGTEAGGVGLRRPLLVILGGLPGTGKTSVARELANRLGAIHLRIDSIEQAIRDAAVLRADVADAGYRAAYAVAEDNLRLGRSVVADSVNPIAMTRAAWRGVAERAGARAAEIELVCSDPAEHRLRVEQREADVPGLVQPTWNDVLTRAYEPWPGARMIDTAGRAAEACAEEVERALR